MAGTVSRLERHLERSIREFFHTEVSGSEPTVQVRRHSGVPEFEISVDHDDLKISVDAIVRKESEPR